MAIAKPFIKWVGGKSQLIEQLEVLLPADFDEWHEATYIEPFVGGGAMLFYMLQRHPNIKSAVINDINPDLITCYKIVRDDPTSLLNKLKHLQDEYYSLDSEGQREMYKRIRDVFNDKLSDAVDNSAYFIFLNRTCFNGLYRVNKSGKFNVPHGKYIHPQIYAPTTIYADSELLRNVEITLGDFEQTFSRVRENTLVYLDPPYRPLSNTSSFNDYTKESFNDEAQIRLKHYCDKLNSVGTMFMLSNSDCLGKDGRDRFFEDLYLNYKIERVWASRNINANPSKRGKITEILVRNFETSNGQVN